MREVAEPAMLIAIRDAALDQWIVGFVGLGQCSLTGHAPLEWIGCAAALWARRDVALTGGEADGEKEDQCMEGSHGVGLNRDGEVKRKGKL